MWRAAHASLHMRRELTEHALNTRRSTTYSERTGWGFSSRLVKNIGINQKEKICNSETATKKTTPSPEARGLDRLLLQKLNRGTAKPQRWQLSAALFQTRSREDVWGRGAQEE